MGRLWARYVCAVQAFAEYATGAGLDVYAYNFALPYAIPGLGDVLGPAHAALREDHFCHAGASASS